MRLGVVLMQAADLPAWVIATGATEALRTHMRRFLHDAFPNPNDSARMTEGYHNVTFTSPTRRTGTLPRASYVYEDTRDRRTTCRTRSGAFSQSASSPLSQLAHSLPKKSLLLSSRFNPSPLPANTDRLSVQGTEQAQASVPCRAARQTCVPAGKPC